MEVPGRLRLIDRNSLLAMLDRAVAGKVTIITGPAGSGKTSLVRSWADRAQGFRPLFTPVQRDQQDAQIFWLSMLSAVRGTPAASDQARAQAGRRRPPWTSAPPRSWRRSWPNSPPSRNAWC
ncbi:ATP-binding protein [Catenulispora yoronensis]